MTNKKLLSEEDICAKYITPAIIASGWEERTQIRRQVYFTDGRIHVRGRLTSRGKRDATDLALCRNFRYSFCLFEQSRWLLQEAFETQAKLLRKLRGLAFFGWV